MQAMSQVAPRRTPQARVRHELAEILERIYALEDAIELYGRKRDPNALERAARDYDAMLAHVDRLGELLREERHESGEPELVA